MTIVIRSAGERTLAACEGVVRRLVTNAGGNPNRQVAVIAERPFAAAVRRTFEIGLEGKRPWLVAIDADVLLLGDGLERIGGVLAGAEGAVFAVTPLVLCKLYGGLCFMGIHGYPRRLLERARGLIDVTGGAANLRPESAVLRAMAERGFGTFAPPVPMGAHDFEQWRRHVYLKMRLRARRWVADAGAGSDTSFADHLAFVDRMAASDADFLAASWGLRDGEADARAGGVRAHYDWDGVCAELATRMQRAGMGEKTAWEGTGAGVAERAMARHDFVGDRRTPQWIRERLGFALGTKHALERIGVAMERGVSGASAGLMGVAEAA